MALSNKRDLSTTVEFTQDTTTCTSDCDLDSVFDVTVTVTGTFGSGDDLWAIQSNQ